MEKQLVSLNVRFTCATCLLFTSGSPFGPYGPVWPRIPFNMVSIWFYMVVGCFMHAVWHVWAHGLNIVYTLIIASIELFKDQFPLFVWCCWLLMFFMYFCIFECLHNFWRMSFVGFLLLCLRDNGARNQGSWRREMLVLRYTPPASWRSSSTLYTTSFMPAVTSCTPWWLSPQPIHLISNRRWKLFESNIKSSQSCVRNGGSTKKDS